VSDRRFKEFINLEPVQRSEDGYDIRKFRDLITCKKVLNLLKAIELRLRNIHRVTVGQVWRGPLTLICRPT